MAKAKSAAAPETVRLFRLQDKFLTDPMPLEEAEGIMEGYPEEYEVYNPEPPAEPVQTEESTDTDPPSPPPPPPPPTSSTTDEQQG